MTMTEAENNERDELAIFKQFFKKYGRLLIILTVFFLVLMVAVNFWYGRRSSTSTKASQIFQEMVYAEIQQDNDAATAKGKQLMSEYKNTPYAQFAGLLLAKMSVVQGDLDAAATNLQWVVDHKRSGDIAGHLATVRLASVLQQQGKLDQALELVSKDSDSAYTSLYAQARGDILVAKGELDKARDAYQLAVQSLPAGAKSPILQMKLLDLGSTNEA